MSIFSAAGGLAPYQVKGYVDALVGLLEGRDPIEVLREGPASLEAAVAKFSPAELARPERPGKWSALEVVWHLADSELVCGFRIRMTLAHDNPPIAPYDQDLWATNLRYRDQPVEAALEQFAALRKANLRIWTSLTAEQWKRAGLHAERGPESMEHMARLYAGHDLAHLRQIERIRSAVSGSTD